MRQFPLIPLVVLGFFLLTASGCPVGSGPQGGGEAPGGGANPFVQPLGTGGGSTGNGMTGGDGTSTDPADPGQTEATPTTVPISPVGATPGFGTCAGMLFFAEDLSATETSESGLARVRGHLQTQMTLPRMEVGMVSYASVRVVLPSGEEVPTVTDLRGCFDVNVGARPGDQAQLIARRTDCDEEVTAAAVVRSGVSTEPPCGNNALPRAYDSSSPGIQEVAPSGSGPASNPKTFSGSKYYQVR